MVNQICIAGLVEGLAEGIHFAKKAGLDVNAVIDTISKGAAQSWQMENRYKTMSEGRFDFGFAVEWMRKDLSICISEARRNGASLPVTSLVDAFYSEVEKWVAAGGTHPAFWRDSNVNGCPIHDAPPAPVDRRRKRRRKQLTSRFHEVVYFQWGIVTNCRP